MMTYQNPYQNALHYPQQQYTQQQPYAQQYNDTIYVNGVNEAASWVVQRGQSVRLWDASEPKFYIKTVGDNGMPNPIEVYRYERIETSPQKEQKTEEYVTRAEFEKRLNELKRPQEQKKENRS